MLSRILQQSEDAHLCVVSTFCHTPCLARLNLNELLAQADLCNFRRSSQNSDPVHARRQQALTTVAEVKPEFLQEGKPMLSISQQFDTSSTLAASPVYGTIYLNRKNQFKDGIVGDQEIQLLRDQVAKLVMDSLAGRFGAGQFVFVPGQSCHEARSVQGGQSGSGNQDWRDLAPDLLVSIGGVELYDIANSPVLDYGNYPRSTHEYSGFVWLSNEQGHANEIKSIDLHRHLLEKIL
jgi:hypothetical protein